ncbi:MAG: PDDEXK nuclease domain-containing protein [Elusimicrobiota bacterium]|jgi:predicted nuclease of restriction endonuclease-like (RecB) superfamily|nr:PDDEXK nuclease domain-containing protein [Elusimicrobiota bacterium]
MKNTNGYRKWLIELKSRIRQSQIKAAVRVNSALIELYWSIGADIVAKQAEAKWGDGLIEKLSADLQKEFPNMQGFSEINLRNTKRFYLFYSQSNAIQHQVGVELEKQHQIDAELKDDKGRQLSDRLTFPKLLGQIPWRHHVEIISKCDTFQTALFYINKTLENGWSRSTLINFIEAQLHNTQGKAINNFARLLPAPQSDLAREILKNSYNFDFLTISDKYNEKELEDALTDNITKFLLELGQDFAFVGKQVPIKVGKKELRIDLLFYHLSLHCYIVVELKIGEFEAEYMGKLGLYVSAINHQRKRENDNQTIGLLICKTKDSFMAKYSLESISQPIGISEYKLSRLFPKNFKHSLPSVKEIEKELKKSEKKRKLK